MEIELAVKVVLLLIVANGAPILAQVALAGRWDQPIDAHCRCADEQPLLGPSKTWRGIIAALVCTPCAAFVLGFAPSTGLIIGATAMCGDLLSSFIKRRLRLPPSSMALGLDQIPESLLPLLILQNQFDLTGLNIAQLTMAFIVLELLLSRILYHFRLRKRPF